MEYLLKCQEWFEHSPIYTEFLVKLPSPLNNVYFDLLILVVGSILLIRWILETIAMRRRYKKVRLKQKKIQEEKEYADMESLYREREARQRQEQMEQQMKMMQMYMMLQFMPKQYQNTVSPEQIQEMRQSLAQQNLLFLPQKENEFERLMHMHGADVIMQEELQNQKAMQEAAAMENQKELDEKLQSKAITIEEIVETAEISPEMQKELEQRRAMAVKLALKEQKRAERKQKRGNRK